jgi:hypothetical protein
MASKLSLIQDNMMLNPQRVQKEAKPNHMPLILHQED